LNSNEIKRGFKVIKKIGVLIVSLLASITIVGLPAHASATVSTMPTLIVSGSTVSTTRTVWSHTGSTPTYDIGNDGALQGNQTEFFDNLLACPTEKAAVTTPTDVSTNIALGCQAIYNATTGHDPATDLNNAWTGPSGNRTLLSTTGKYFAVRSVYSLGTGTTFVSVMSATIGYSGSGSGGSDSSETTVAVPSPKIPTINQMAAGPLLVTPGTNAVLTGSRLNCTTYVKVNNVATTFTYSTLSDGSGQLSIAMPSSLRAGKHALTMDSCGGEVTYLNVLTVAKAPVELRLDLANASDRALGLIELRAFMREHRADYNTVTCTADSANRSQQKIASQVVARYCHEAFSRLAMPMNRTTSVKSDYQGRSLILTVSLSNR
jgi:hypothetical protein